MTTESTDQTGAPAGVPDPNDFAAFQAAAEAADAGDVGDEDGEDGNDAADPLPDAPEAPKPKQTAQQRIDELTAARRQAEREAADAVAEAAHWRAQAEQQNPRGRPAQPAPADAQGVHGDDGRPNPEDFADGVYDPAYVEALTDWKVDQALTTRSQADAQAREIEAARSTFDTRTATLFPDGEPEGLKVIRTLKGLNPNVAVTIMDMDDGPKVADFLGTNLAELNRISALAPHRQVLELAKISAGLNAAPQPKRQSGAPPPPEGHARGAGGQFAVQPDTKDFAAFKRQFGSA